MTKNNCTNPNLVTEAELQAYAQGEELPAVAAHLRRLCGLPRQGRLVWATINKFRNYFMATRLSVA